MKEVWKPVIGWEGFYEVSNMGNVKSLGNGKSNNKNYSKERILKAKKERNGYLFVALYKEGKSKQCYIHRLVGEAFLENPQDLPQINHIDQNKENNIVSNLEFCSAEYNINYGDRTERVAEKLTNNPKKSKAIIAIDIVTGLILEFPSAREASRQLKVNRSGIVACLKGRGKTCGGFYWFYASTGHQQEHQEE